MPYFFYFIDNAIPICRLPVPIFSGHNLIKEPTETISVSRCRFGGIFFFIDVKLAGEIFIPPNLHLLTLIAFL